MVSVIRPEDQDAQGKVIIKTKSGDSEEFDHVIFATHTDQALKILGENATPDEKRILGAIKFVKNQAILHRDVSFMPKRRKAWASWNYLTTSMAESRSQNMCLTYWMNRLQPFIDPKEYGHVFVTMNPPTQPEEETVLGRFEYDHPAYSPEVSTRFLNHNSFDRLLARRKL